MDEFKDSVKRGFTACRTDIDTLKLENQMLKEHLKNLETSNSNLSAELKGIKIALDYIKEFKETQTVQQVQPQVAPQQIAAPLTQTKAQDPYEALLAFKAKANKREMLKQKLISMISENGMHLSELKFMFVEHFRYCSKATFYNYLKELEAEQTIKQKREQSKTFVYLTESLLNEI